MSWVTREIAHCDECGFEWMPKGDPLRCASQKCRKRSWNSGSVVASVEPTAAVDRPKRERVRKVVEVEPEAVEDSGITDEDIPEISERIAPISSHNCPKKALHPKVVKCSICDYRP
jgi:hypothetical protein